MSKNKPIPLLKSDFQKDIQVKKKTIKTKPNKHLIRLFARVYENDKNKTK